MRVWMILNLFWLITSEPNCNASHSPQLFNRLFITCFENLSAWLWRWSKLTKTLRSSHWAGGEWPWVKRETEAVVLLFCNNTETFQNYYHSTGSMQIRGSYSYVNLIYKECDLMWALKCNMHSMSVYVHFELEGNRVVELLLWYVWR